MKKNFEIGAEVEIQTTDGATYQGILMRKEKSHVYTVGKLGIILTFPLSAINEMKRLG